MLMDFAPFFHKKDIDGQNVKIVRKDVCFCKKQKILDLNIAGRRFHGTQTGLNSDTEMPFHDPAPAAFQSSGAPAEVNPT